MMPREDVTWPRCKLHNERHWCDWTRSFLIEGGDASEIGLGERISAPINPFEDLYATVSIDAEELFPGCAKLAVIVEHALQDEELIDIGLWSKGEGRMAISSVLLEWCRGLPNGADCQNSLHNLTAEAGLKSGLQKELKSVLWTLATRKMCLACAYRTDKALQGFDDNFGLGQVVNSSVRAGTIQGSAISVTTSTPPNAHTRALATGLAEYLKKNKHRS